MADCRAPTHNFVNRENREIFNFILLAFDTRSNKSAFLNLQIPKNSWIIKKILYHSLNMATSQNTHNEIRTILAPNP